MYKYSFRAECIHDALDYAAVVAEIAKVMSLTVNQDAMFPDCDVEIATALSLEELQLAVSRVDDAHLIQESMRPMYQRKS
jgi:hypothetical protein